MDFFSKLGLSRPPRIFKIVGFGTLAVIAFVFTLSLVGSTLRSVMPQDLSSYMPGLQMEYGGDASYDYAARDGSYGKEMMSTRNVSMPVPPTIGGTTGNNAEEFEVTDYNATIETGDREGTCAAVAALKESSFVIFESANESDTTCSYTFKVAHDRVPEILMIITQLNPKDLLENTYTIKRQIDDFTSEEEVLKNKKTSIEQTLRSALAAYQEITDLATRTQDTETLAKIIDSRIQVIERLTTESIAVNEQLDRLSRAKADQLDRLEYTYFNVYVYERTYIDTEQLGDSWRAAIQKFVTDVNRSFQDATIGLITFLFALVPFLMYFFVLLLIAKYGWRFVKGIWGK